MRRWSKRLFWALATLIGVPLLAALLLYTFSDTGVGRRSIEGLAAFFSGDQVTITGLDGSFPYSLRATHVEVADDDGVWLKLDNVAIEWSPWGFLSDNVQIASAHAAHAELLRFPRSTSTDETPDSTRYEVGRLIIDRAEFSREVTGRPFTLTLQARGHYTNGHDAQWVVTGAEKSGRGTYRSEGTIDAQQIRIALAAREAAHGWLAGLVGLPDIGAVTVDANLWGPRQAENVNATVHAGAAQLRATGGLDLVKRSANLAVSLHAPAMAPRPDLTWQSLALDGTVRGSFAKPEAAGKLAVSDLRFAGASAVSISGDLEGTEGAVHFRGQADGVRLPVNEPDILSATPVKVAIDADLDGKNPQIDFQASHMIVDFGGHATLGDHTIVKGTLTLARVAPFAELAGLDIDGGAVLTASIDSTKDGDRYHLDGTVNAEGSTLLSRLLGSGAQVLFDARTSATGFTIDKAHVASRGVTLDASGGQTGETLAIAYSAALHDLSRLAGDLRGQLAAEGRVDGNVKSFAVTAKAAGSAATKDYEQGPVSLTLNAQGLPDAISGTLEAQGRFDAAPLRLSASFAPRGTAHAIALKALDWRSVHATGDFVVPRDARAVTGRADVRIGQLADIGLLIGQSLKGALIGTVDIAAVNGRTDAGIHANATGFAVAGVTTQTLAIDGRIGDPFGTPDANLTLKAGGLATAGFTGTADARVDGPSTALHVALTSDLKNGADAVPLVADATLNLDAKTATLAKLETNYRGAPFRLTAPAHADFRDGLAVDQLQLLSDTAEIRIAGRLAPNLGATVSLRNASPDLIQIFVPSLDAEGSISGDAKLGGTLDAPTGTVSVNATNFRMRGMGSGLPPATITANGTLHGATMALTARIDAGARVHLSLDGSAPLSAGGTFDMAANGTLDLTVLEPVLAANGRRVRGLVNLNGRFTGALAAPRASGTAVLTGGEFDDFQQGVRITDIAANLDAKGDTVTISKLSARAGRGTISGNGTVALWADGIPLDLTVTMVNARPLATDQFTANLDANLKVTGSLRDKMTISGTARIDSGEINIAESYPPEVAVLDVRHSRTAPAPPKPPARAPFGLDLTVTAPSRIYVRGRGLDAEVSGTIGVKGNSNAPLVTGGFTMRRGELNLGGATVQFSSGKITFDGQSVNGSFDPALDFTAQSTSGSVVANLTITGHASAPKILLSSSPVLPQDEVLAHLLFGQSVAQLNALQLAQIAQAFAAIGGLGGGFNPLGVLRRTLGLDRLAVGSAASGNGATIEVGKNIAGNIYVGAKQDTAGGTQAVAQIDLTEHLKLQATVTAVASATPTTPTATPQENGTSVGLSYTFEY